MKKRIITSILLLGLILTVVTACGNDDTETTVLPPADGDNGVTVTAYGNIEALTHETLTFGSGGKVAEITVSEGETVSKGDVLARLDTGALELAEAQAQVALTQAQVALAQAELAQQTATNNLENTHDTEVDLELALSNAQIGVLTARYNLENAVDLYTWSDIKAAKADVDDAQRYLDDLLWKAGLYLPIEIEGENPSILEYILGDDFLKSSSYEGWQEELIYAQLRLNTAENRLDAMLSGSDPEEVTIKKMQLEAAEKAEVQAQNNLEKLAEEITIRELEVASADKSVEYARQNINLAEKSLIEARKHLEEATIKAPFDGIVADIGVKEGEFLSPAAYTEITIVELVDMSHMELIARVAEQDVVMVETGQKVNISIDALPETVLEGRVTFISPVARQSAAILFEDEDEEKEYEVKIEFNLPKNSPIRTGMNATAKIIVE